MLLNLMAIINNSELHKAIILLLGLGRLLLRKANACARFLLNLPSSLHESKSLEFIMIQIQYYEMRDCLLPKWAGIDGSQWLSINDWLTEEVVKDPRLPER